jgi:hypothetical protein
MNLKKEFNRLSDYFTSGTDKMGTMTEEMSEKMRSHASHLSERAREGLRQSKDSLMSTEDMLVEHMRQNSMLYIITGLLLVLAIVAKLTHYTARRPMREEW